MENTINHYIIIKKMWKFKNRKKKFYLLKRRSGKKLNFYNKLKKKNKNFNLKKKKFVIKKFFVLKYQNLNM